MARKRKGNPIHGWLVIDKPAGMTSTQVLARARWLLQAQKAGHGGTLDPLATGVLPIAFGEATKTVAYAMDGRKTYQFTLCWGEQRTTDDTEGTVIATHAHRPDGAAIEAALPRFTGVIDQTPPPFSAIKVDGERAYDLAREGIAVILEPRPVRIDRFVLIGQADADHAEFRVDCGKGTYVRALARDLALALGTVAHITVLRRLRVGRFTLDNAISLDDLTQRVQSAAIDHLLLPIETALDDIPALALSAPEAHRLKLGQSVTLLSRQDRDQLLGLGNGSGDGQGVAIAMCGSTPVALVRVEGAEIRPVRVLNL
ncbi:MAG: tRNA pseudouridine(55) synthase TruB [Azospirillaceae bacterium]|nr:tRNA pseudouridine(55) synthase TruB [Azospirillaceae bacterium]